MKYVEPFDIGGFCASPPAREVWIEIFCVRFCLPKINVTSREGGVD